MSGQDQVESVAELLADETARRILLETRSQPMSADALSDCCGVSPSTIYRRIDDLQAHDLLVERTQPDEDGHHYTVYVATLDRVVVDVTDDGYDVELQRRERGAIDAMADRFTEFVEGI